MVGKRHSGIVDHTMFSKMPRVEAAPQHSVPYAGKSISKDPQVCKNFLTYPVSGSEGQHSLNPWSSTTAYLQYAGNALNHHLQSGGVSKCQRPETERIKNPFQLVDNSSSQFTAHRHPVHNYQMSPSRAYPQFAVPRPVYRSPSSFMDPAYQTLDFQSMGAQTHCPAAVEWSSSTRFPYSSAPLYVTGMKNLHPVNNGYLEASGGLTSVPVQELGPVKRHRTDINTPVGSSYYQEDAFTDPLHPFAQHNIQLLRAEGSVSVGKPRNSAFTTPSHEHYKCMPYQGSLDTRMGHMYSKAYYDSAIDRYHQRSALYPCNGDKSLSPLSIKGSPNYGKTQKLHSGYLNPEPKAITHDIAQMSQAQAEIELQINNASRTNRELQMCAAQRDKASLFGSGPMVRDFYVNSANMNKEHVLHAAHESSDLQERALYEKGITEQSSHTSFLQQNSSSKISPIVPTKSMIAIEPVKESSLTSKLPSSPGSLYNLDDLRKSNAVFDKQAVQNYSQMADTAHSNSTMLKSSGSIYQRQRSDGNQTSSQKAQAVQSAGCSSTQDSKMHADVPNSPPMPVINDVFSLAPYRAYLEGKAPHPFPVHQESKVENLTSTSFSSKQSYPAENVGEVEKDACKTETIPAVVNTTVCHNIENKPQKANAQTGESQDVCFRKDTMNTEALDLSLKRSTQKSSSMEEQVKVPHTSQKPPSPQKVVERNLSQISEDLPIKDQDSCLSKVTRIMPHSEKELHMSQTTVITSSPSVQNSPSRTTEKTSHLAQESFATARTYICQSSCPTWAPETRAQERQKCTEATQNLVHENHGKHSLHSNKHFLSPPYKSYSHQAINSQPIYLNEKCKSPFTKNLSHQVVGNCTSQTLKNFTLQARGNGPSQAAEDKSDQSYATKYLSIQAFETQAHNRQETDTTQIPKTSPPQKNCSQTTETVPYNSYYNCISESVHNSAQSANLPIFVNAMQTPTTFFPQAIIYSSPAAVFCTKNLSLPSQQHQNISAEPTERRGRMSVDSCRSETSLSGSENEGTGFQSSKAFMLRKYKMTKFSSSGPEIQEANSNSTSCALLRTFMVPSDAAQSLPPSAPESSPTLGEANVSLASADEVTVNGSRHQFSELHRLVRAAITTSVARSPLGLLEDWLEKTKEAASSKTPAKTKSGSRPNDPSPESTFSDIWQEFDGVRLRLHKLLSQLETFMFTRSCPFPHVIRAGAIFIPIYLVKEVLFPELGTSVDRVLQKHKVELRPTTLSEEKLLRDTELKDCSSRLLKLLALKQLPDVYPDLLRLFCENTIQDHLGSRTQSELHTHK